MYNHTSQNMRTSGKVKQCSAGKHDHRSYWPAKCLGGWCMQVFPHYHCISTRWSFFFPSKFWLISVGQRSTSLWHHNVLQKHLSGHNSATGKAYMMATVNLEIISAVLPIWHNDEDSQYFKIFIYFLKHLWLLQQLCKNTFHTVTKYEHNEISGK